ncbi:hypothetical protein BOSEA31B_10697 [Hyphomicrobiales bacterium]|nr:hypothetical protein BOSEA31B_10697 [Hyphomicrobiales bacterium]
MGRQIDVDARTEADQAEALAGRQRVALLDEGHDAAGNQPGDLHDADDAGGRLDRQRVALVVVARLVELGIEEEAGRIGDLGDAAGHRRAVHMAVEDVHEDRDARHRLGRQLELRRRQGLCDLADPAIGRRDHQPLPLRRDTDGVAEEIADPDRDDRTDPAEGRPEIGEHDGRHQPDGDEDVALLVDGHDHLADGIDERHEAGSVELGRVERARMACRYADIGRGRCADLGGYALQGKPTGCDIAADAPLKRFLPRALRHETKARSGSG